MDDGQPRAFGVRDRPETARVAIHPQLAGERSSGIASAENLEQRGFAGAVLADERMNLTGRDREVDTVECAYAGELLADAPHLEQRRSRSGHRLGL